MPIFVPEPIIERGKLDAKRHREKQKEVIKKNLPAIISEEAIITGKRDKIIKIPIKSIEIPQFKRGGSGNAGVGMGKGKVGDIISRRPIPNGDGRGAGSKPGVDYIETEIEISELIELMIEDLGLPRFEEKEIKQAIIDLGYKIAGRAKSGPWVLIDRRATAREFIRTFWFTLQALIDLTGRSKFECFDALKQAQGVLADALKIIEDPNFVSSSETIEPFPIPRNEDVRFSKIEKDTKLQSSAVVIAMMDVSGSMSTEKKYLARSMLFWLVEFLRRLYETVEIRFIIHHATAKLVDEESFFKTGESGGTVVHTAYELANDLIKGEYPTSGWNVYAWHFSDGDDFDPDKAALEVEKLFNLGINMFGYGEIRTDEDTSKESSLMKAFKEKFSLKTTASEKDKMLMILGQDDLPFLGVMIEKKEHIWPALKQFLKKDRWTKE